LEAPIMPLNSLMFLLFPGPPSTFKNNQIADVTFLPALDGGANHADEQLEHRLALVRLSLPPRPAAQRKR